MTINIFPSEAPPAGKTYVVGLLSFNTYNSIPNIQEGCNKFYYANDVFTFDSGAYELDVINETLQSVLGKENISLYGDHTTLKTKLKCTQDVDFSKPNSIGPLLGFSPRLLRHGDGLHVSDEKVNIFSVNSINIDLDIAQSGYKNGEKTPFYTSVHP